jgi:hypothetical protein
LFELVRTHLAEIGKGNDLARGDVSEVLGVLLLDIFDTLPDGVEFRVSGGERRGGNSLSRFWRNRGLIENFIHRLGRFRDQRKGKNREKNAKI